MHAQSIRIGFHRIGLVLAGICVGIGVVFIGAVMDNLLVKPNFFGGPWNLASSDPFEAELARRLARYKEEGWELFLVGSAFLLGAAFAYGVPWVIGWILVGFTGEGDKP